MGPTILTLLMGVTAPQPSGPSIFQLFGMIGGLLGFVALATLPWTIKKLRAETQSIQVTTGHSASDIAVKHLQVALEEADKTLQRIKEDTQSKLATFEQQVTRLTESLEQERIKSEKERELYERRIVQLLYDLHAKDVEIANLRQGRNSGPVSL